MQYPSAMFIESAQDMLKDGAVSEEGRAIQIKEYQSATGNQNPDCAAAYELGLQTARVMLAGSPKLFMNGIDPKDVL
jgi:hypothetical protein